MSHLFPTREEQLAKFPRPDAAMRAPSPNKGSGSVYDQADGLIRSAINHRAAGRTVDAGEDVRTLDDLIGVRADGLFIGGADLTCGRVSLETVMALRFGPRDDERDAEIAARVRARKAAQR